MPRLGKYEKLRPFLARETNRQKRVLLLSFAAAALEARADKQGAVGLRKEARPLATDAPRNRQELAASEAYPLALAKAEPEEAFEFAEKLLGRADYLIKASNDLRGFRESHLLDDTAVGLEGRRRQLARNSRLSIAILRILASANFERTYRLAETFSYHEQKIFFRWYILNALLNNGAESEEAMLDDSEICG